MCGERSSLGLSSFSPDFKPSGNCQPRGFKHLKEKIGLKKIGNLNQSNSHPNSSGSEVKEHLEGFHAFQGAKPKILNVEEMN